MTRKLTTRNLIEMKAANTKIVSLTAYDASFARVLDNENVDVILVGDSLGMVIQGAANTLAVSMRDMIYHSAIVSGVVERGLVVVDMPFMSYTSTAQALGNAARLVSEGGADVVKLEGGAIILESVRALTEHGIAVCGHLGLTPQSIHQLGGYHVQGRDFEAAAAMRRDALDLQAAGACMLVLECVPGGLAGEISRSLSIPVIGIGAGDQCDGQVLVLQDMLGISGLALRFSRNFLADADSIQQAVSNYVSAVRDGSFPAPEHHMAP